MTPLVLDPVVVAAVELACEQFLKLQRQASARPPASERENVAAVTRESARPTETYELR